MLGRSEKSIITAAQKLGKRRKSKERRFRYKWPTKMKWKGPESVTERSVETKELQKRKKGRFRYNYIWRTKKRVCSHPSIAEGKRSMNWKKRRSRIWNWKKRRS